MKPQRIFLIRHGESEGNVDKTVYTRKPDYALSLTTKGIQQVNDAGKKIRDIIKEEDIFFYISPFWRARETYLGIHKYLNCSSSVPYEDSRLREQEWGHRNGKSFQGDLEEERDSYGHFYFRFPDGESCADVYDRISDFLNTLFRDFQKPEMAKNIGIVFHGMTMRVFLMRWFHMTVEEFEILANPKNAEFLVLEYNELLDQYQLTSTVRKYDSHKHPYQFDWTKEI